MSTNIMIMINIVTMDVMRSKPDKMKVTMKTAPIDIPRDRIVSSNMVKYCS